MTLKVGFFMRKYIWYRTNKNQKNGLHYDYFSLYI